MALVSYYIYIKLHLVISSKILLIFSLLIGIIVYVISILMLKILSEEEIFMIPYGQKLYQILTKIGVYKSEEKAVK